MRSCQKSAERVSRGRNQNLKITASSNFQLTGSWTRRREGKVKCPRTEIGDVLTYTCTTIAICSSLSIGPPDPPLCNLPRRSSSSVPNFVFLTFQEVKLHNGTPAQRRVWDDLATIYSIIVCLEFVEKAYVRDTITQAQCLYEVLDVIDQ